MVSIPKPTKAGRSNIIKRAERRKKDALWQSEVPSEGNCQCCQFWKPLVGDHVVKRRYSATRHDPLNRRNLCAECNGSIEALPAEKLLKKYPLAEDRLLSLWREKIFKKH